jgi:Zinc dependent phospholipase C
VFRLIVPVATLLLLQPALRGYSVLTHEAIIDSAWDDSIKPVLLAHFPNATAPELTAAHGYAYAGSIIQDMGYYPFGSRFFSDVTHYVRSGDFVINLIREAQDLNEYAFALGALAHYAADTQGHSIAVNPAVALEYPKLRREFGPQVTYEDKPTAHIRVEFSFDVLQVSRGNYAPQSYHDFIGFQVAKGSLERAFRDTYSLEMKDVFKDVDLALGTYRRAVSVVIPELTRAAWHIKSKDLQKTSPGVTRRKFVYNVSRASYRKEWDGKWQEAGIGMRILVFLVRILPKVGPLKALAFKPPTAQTESLFQTSFDRTLSRYRGFLKQGDLSKLQLPDLNFDTGEPTRPTAYHMADDCYAKLVIKLADHDLATMDPKLREDILAFYKDLDQPFATRTDPKAWKKTLAALDKLKAQTAKQTVGAVK